MAWPASIPTFAPGPAVTTVADLNALRDALNAIGDAWTAYTPTLTASTSNPTMGTSSITGRYRKMGKTADVHINLTIGASGWAPGSGGYIFSLPSGVSPLLTNSSEALGFGTLRDVAPSAVARGLLVYRFSSTTVACLMHDNSILSHNSPITWAAGDLVSIHIPSLEIA